MTGTRGPRFGFFGVFVPQRAGQRTRTHGCCAKLSEGERFGTKDPVRGLSWSAQRSLAPSIVSGSCGYQAVDKTGPMFPTIKKA